MGKVRINFFEYMVVLFYLFVLNDIYLDFIFFLDLFVKWVFLILLQLFGGIL